MNNIWTQLDPLRPIIDLNLYMGAFSNLYPLPTLV